MSPEIRYSRGEYALREFADIVCPENRVVRDRSRATACREPCQAGNRAALSGVGRVPRQTGFESGFPETGCSAAFEAHCTAKRVTFAEYGKGGLLWTVWLFTDNTGKRQFQRSSGRPASHLRWPSRSAPAGYPMRTSLPAREAQERRPAPRYWPGPYAASRRSTAAPATSVRPAAPSSRARPWI